MTAPSQTFIWTSRVIARGEPQFAATVTDVRLAREGSTGTHGPAITVPPLQAKLADPRPSCRNAILDAIDRLQQRTGAAEFARGDIVAEVQNTDADFERQTIYRCLRRMTGHEPGSAHHDLEDLGNDRLRLRGD